MAETVAFFGLIAAVGAAVWERAPVTGSLLTIVLFAAWLGGLDDGE